MPVKRTKKLTIKDIAQMCNVSTQTVSRVINQHQDVSERTRHMVEKAIAEMGYRPSALARSLVRQRSYTLGVIMAGLIYVGVLNTLNGITEESEKANYTIFFKELPNFNTPDIVPVIESLMAHQVEGIIFAAPAINENVQIAQSQLPVNCPPIVFLKCQPNANYETISIDNYGGARKAVEYLLATGRRQIGLLSGPLSWLEARQRKQGWEDALKNFGIEPSPCQWVESNWMSDGGEAAFAELLARYPTLDGLFASNDQMALGALHLANQRGIKVPEDIAIFGFDNLPESAYFSPSLSTVTHPLRQLGNLAVQTLLKQIEGGDASPSGSSLTLPTELVLRDSAPRTD